MQPATRNRLTALAISLLAIALGLGLAFGWTVVRLLRPDRTPRFTNTAAVLTQIQSLAQLVTVKYVMEKVVILEDVRIYGESRVLLVAHGVVKAGVDLSKIERGDIDVDGTNVIIRLPRCTITDVYLDEDKTQVLEHSTGLLRRFDKDLQQNARREGLDAIRRAARDSGILDEAQIRAELQLRLFFGQFGFTEIEFRE
ncbi:MAG TPA: DUF4230 domain-containing protein [Verrucomicrobiota bacterium]|nr:DUF4230 domain-containing protein [Verrucomicrobiota bacterium]HRZ36203.1 DUF4230 domain-containing protein [Candidatus Paceibacterota bacterium]HRZ58177.1 DUF4230 domain-containing protein [Candidatus Paceibacterota bacterium]